VVVHLGLGGPLKDASHHNIHFARDYRASFDDLLAGRMQRDPSWFLTVPTQGDPSMAPDGGAVGFYLLPAPNLHGDDINWDAQAPRELRAALRRLEEAGYGTPELVTSAVVTPADWARQGMAAGTPFAVSHHFFQTGPFRPRNVAPTVEGVVFAGSSTVPGVGVPMVLVSGKLAAERVLQGVRPRRPGDVPLRIARRQPQIDRARRAFAPVRLEHQRGMELELGGRRGLGRPAEQGFDRNERDHEEAGGKRDRRGLDRPVPGALQVQAEQEQREHGVARDQCQHRAGHEPPSAAMRRRGTIRLAS
jgi:hypothetical protein